MLNFHKEKLPRGDKQAITTEGNNYQFAEEVPGCDDYKKPPKVYTFGGSDRET
jgi:hypothetical protein